MKEISKEMWVEWKNHPVTKVRNQAINQRITDCQEEILKSENPDYDKMVKGMVRAFREVLEVELE